MSEYRGRRAGCGAVHSVQVSVSSRPARLSVCGTMGRDEVEGWIERGFSRCVLEKEQERGGMSLARGGWLTELAKSSCCLRMKTLLCLKLCLLLLDWKT